MHDKLSFVFWITLILYLVTVFSVPYVGVYLTYVAIPVIVISGFFAYITRPKESCQIETVEKNDETERIKVLEEKIKEIDRYMDSKD